MSKSKMYTRAFAIVALLLSLWLATLRPIAKATNLTLASGGVVSVEFVFTDASYISNVSVVSPVNRLLFNTSATRLGTTVFLGNFAAGTVFEFELLVTTGDPSVTYTWSSDPAKNADGKDHVITTQIDPGTFKMGWEDMPNLGDQDFNDAVMVVHIGGDSDGDGLWDLWETNGVDNDWDGTIDLPINQPPYNANPNHKDVFVEIDWMQDSTHSHQPKAGVVNMVVQAFANAPVSNPDGINGITLHVDVSNSVPHQNHLRFDPPTGVGDFDVVKASNFDSARRSVYHYCLFIHDLGYARLYSGLAELPGNDFMVAFGGWHVGGGDIDGDGTSDENVGTVQEQAGTLMHELGHNLDLHHGGGDDFNYKPNYLSIMNYWFQLDGLQPGNILDYSDNALPTLTELHLDERVGIQDGAFTTSFYDPTGTDRSGAGSGAIDWDWDGVIESDVSVDINFDGVCVTAGNNHVLNTQPSGDDVIFGNEIHTGPDRTCDSTAAGDDLQVNPLGWVEPSLIGFDDWDNIKYVFTDTKDFEDGVHTTPPLLVELDYETAMMYRREVYVDIKHGSWPNPLKLKSKGVLPVAICGTEDFDVTTIDTKTILLTLEGIGVAPLRWSYEDVATPYMGEPCSGHALGADGFLDLALKFNTEEIIKTLGLKTHAGQKIILILTGNLKAEHDGTPIYGQDCIVILNT